MASPSSPLARSPVGAPASSAGASPAPAAPDMPAAPEARDDLQGSKENLCGFPLELGRQKGPDQFLGGVNGVLNTRVYRAFAHSGRRRRRRAGRQRTCPTRTAPQLPTCWRLCDALAALASQSHAMRSAHTLGLAHGRPRYAVKHRMVFFVCADQPPRPLFPACPWFLAVVLPSPVAPPLTSR